MLQNSTSFSSYSVSSADDVRDFYSQTLGLSIQDDNPMLTLLLPSGGKVMLYPKGEAHQPAEFTVLNFMVEDLAQTVQDLTNKDIAFERYLEMNPNELGIHNADGKPDMGPPIAWFKDPCGNIISLIQD